MSDKRWSLWLKRNKMLKKWKVLLSLRGHPDTHEVFLYMVILNACLWEVIAVVVASRLIPALLRLLELSSRKKEPSIKQAAQWIQIAAVGCQRNKNRCEKRGYVKNRENSHYSHKTGRKTKCVSTSHHILAQCPHSSKAANVSLMKSCTFQALSAFFGFYSIVNQKIKKGFREQEAISQTALHLRSTAAMLSPVRKSNSAQSA